MPRIFGQEVQGKTLWIVLGVIAAGVAVVVYVRARAGAGSSANAAPQAAPDEGFSGGGGGGGISVPAPSGGYADNYNTQLDQVRLDAARFGLEQEKREAEQASRAFDLNATLQKGYNDLQLALFGQQQQVGEAYAGYERAAYQGAQAGQELVNKSIKGKGKVECPVGQHFVVLADGSTACQAKGGGGFNFSTITKGVADIATGLFGGAAAAAPGIGYGAANAYAGKRLRSGANTPRASTPPIAPYGGGYA